MSARSSEQIKQRIENAAETQGVDLDVVREVDSNSGYPRFRVLAVDAEDEVDQVGFEIEHPEGPLADQMFSNNLQKRLRKLKDVINGTETADDSGHDELEKLAEESDAVDRAETSETDSRPQQSQGDEDLSRTDPITITVDVELTDEAEVTLDELTEMLEDYHEQLDDLEKRIGSLEHRLNEVEEPIEALRSA